MILPILHPADEPTPGIDPLDRPAPDDRENFRSFVRARDEMDAVMSDEMLTSDPIGLVSDYTAAVRSFVADPVRDRVRRVMAVPEYTPADLIRDERG